jgi:lon-related putative ATP-dependent protease
MYGFVTTGGMKPESIPIKVKVVLQGSPWLYYLLYAYDEDYRKLFKVKADFGVDIKAESSQRMQYAHFIAKLCGKEGLLPFDRSAVAATVEQASRQAENQKKLSLRFSVLADLVRESCYWAREAGAKAVSHAHVERALEEKVYRSNLLEERIQELIEEGTILVDVQGSVVGQVNGLSVYDLGDFSFGKPSRITARIFSGKAGVVNIEREAKLSGKIHSKGVLILSGCLGGKYAQEEALALSATLCFEQSYGEVEGDSASAAELFAILSGLAEVPLRQDLAVTGSINQRGEIQAVGGINEKIEGFYAVCKAKGLTGEQGVLIPESNVRHLMLKPEVVRAVEAGQFHLFAVRTADEGMALLTGLTVGERQADGGYPQGTINARIARRLREMAKRAEKAAGAEAAGEKKTEEGNEGK